MSQGNKQSRGFTLIEIMVAVSIFAIVATIVMGALLAANAANQRAQAVKLAMDNLNFALDSITIKMRQGTEFEVVGGALQFTSPKVISGGNSPKTYIYEKVGDSLQVTEGSGQPRTITSKELIINNVYFSVDRLNNDVNIAVDKATIVIEGTARIGQQEQTFAVQTAVTERL